MTGDVVISLGKVFLDTLRHQKTGRDVETELNKQLVDESWKFEGYDGETVEIEVESIIVRPKYSPQDVSKGVKRVEADHLFTDLEKDRTEAMFFERANAVLKDKWITVVRLDIRNGEAESIRPPGLPLGYVTATTSSRYDGYEPQEHLKIIPEIRVAKTHDLQSDKLEMKIRYDGSIGEYRNHLSDSVDLLKHLQKNMDAYVIQYLCELHYSVYAIDGSEFADESAERVEQLGEHLIGQPVDVSTLEKSIKDIRKVIENAEETNEQTA